MTGSRREECRGRLVGTSEGTHSVMAPGDCLVALWLLLTLIAAVLLMSLVVIPREEAYLQARFSSEYLPYKNSVRRWL